VRSFDNQSLEIGNANDFASAFGFDLA
jgi:hypothetical protein